jgi:hypothetical protein
MFLLLCINFSILCGLLNNYETLIINSFVENLAYIIVV